MHQSSLDKMERFYNQYLKDLRQEQLFIVDLGSQDVNGTYKPFFDAPSWTYLGIDMSPGKNVDLVLADPYQWNEIASNSVDIVISGQAFEHIEFFWLTMEEIARVMKPGGLCCIIAPSGGIEHRYPVDCWRFYPDGFSALARYAKLIELETYTQWNSDSYTDGSEIWNDTVLIAQKPPVESP